MLNAKHLTTIVLLGLFFTGQRGSFAFAVDANSPQQDPKKNQDIFKLLSEVELQKTKAVLSGLEGQYKNQKSEVTALQEKLKEKDEQLIKLTHALESNQESEGKIIDLQNEISALNQALEEKENSLFLKEREIEEQKKVIDGLRSELMAADATVKLSDRMERESLELKDRVSELQQKLTDREMMLRNREEELRRLKEGEKERMDRQEEVNRSQGELQQMLQDKEKVIFGMEGEIERQKHEIAALQAGLSQASEQAKSFEQSRQELGELKNRLAAISEELRIAREGFAKKESAYDGLRYGWEKKIGALENEKASFLREKEGLLKEKESLLNEQGLLKEAVKKLQITLEETKASVHNPLMDRDFRILTETLVKKEETIRELESQIASLRHEIDYQRQAAGLKEKRLADSELFVARYSRQISETLDLLERKILPLLEEIEAQKKIIISLQKELESSREMAADALPRPPTAQVDKGDGIDAQKKASELKQWVEELLK